MFGENTEKGREKFQEDLETTHELFKNFVARYRQNLSIDDVATGEVWLGIAALGKHLADELKTSDQVSRRARAGGRTLPAALHQKKSLPERFGMAASTIMEHGLLKGWSRLNEQRFWQ